MCCVIQNQNLKVLTSWIQLVGVLITLKIRGILNRSLTKKGTKIKSIGQHMPCGEWKEFFWAPGYSFIHKGCSEKLSLQVTHRQHKYMHILQFLLQIVLIAFNRTCMCNVTWWSFIFSKNFNLILSFWFWKFTDAENTDLHKCIHTHTYICIHTVFWVQKQVCLYCCYQQLPVLLAFCFLGLSSLKLVFALKLTFPRQPTRCPQPLSCDTPAADGANGLAQNFDSLQKPNCQTAD